MELRLCVRVQRAQTDTLRASALLMASELVGGQALVACWFSISGVPGVLHLQQSASAGDSRSAYVKRDCCRMWH